MAIKVHGRQISPYVRVVLLVLYEKGVDFELVSSDQHSDEYMAMLNPFGKHPAVEDDGFLLYESRAIVRYFATKYESREPNLLGSTPHERALVDQWTEVQGQIFHHPILKINSELYLGPTFYKKNTDLAVVKQNCAKLELILDIYDARLAKNQYLAGNFYSMADLIHIPMLYILLTHTDQGSLITRRKHVYAWYRDISCRPAWRKILETQI
ncbi:glutathione S-transferase [Marchantia polymorpha subsp. ruderalis]|uniref:glutathione transferase n=1 Tax=Marchantia polymorpha TaxID=3197 RepID=A0A2R6WM33_MARPO|nr:hypothetical protein MARPO_0075s0030 [Marchantia polymorpha]BBN00852.1 hypothetical protein Mp_2g02670 [Marchantia polymorpha subsp. ruderalis]|eukprot:PTQ34906.1 hypothetical protein MARPO_0075s0030 [Marchantia polymorpha]